MTLPAMLLVSALTPIQQPLPPPPPPSASAPAAADAAQAHLDLGLKLFVRHQFTGAEGEFQKAQEADPKSAAATFYLAYTMYKIAEPKRPFHPEKQKAAEMFARAYSLDPGFRPVWGTQAAPKK